uniref:T-cell receptor alpha/delta variable 8.0 n=1 Tax=Sinocyclocheilus grahami TaxID=75366 RepID=A0A672N5I6_SINGR
LNALLTVILLFLTFSPGNIFAYEIITRYTEKYVLEGGKVALSCNYVRDNIRSCGDVNNLQWYRQYPGSQPEYLILITEYSEPDLSLRLSAKASKDIKQVNLTISSAEETDSALYYCALEPTVTGNLRTLYKNLLYI